MIYCLEDDADIRELDLYTLTSMNFDAKGFENAKSFFDALKDEIPDLIVLDVMLPDLSGVDVLKRIRQSSKTASVPIIVATARGAEYEKIKALDLGADDYLTKPFSMMELVARIKAILRRSKNDSDISLDVTFENIVINEQKHTVFAGDKKLDLSLKEFEFCFF